jgi:hypothetical protein
MFIDTRFINSSSLRRRHVQLSEHGTPEGVRIASVLTLKFVQKMVRENGGRNSHGFNELGMRCRRNLAWHLFREL